MHPGYINNFESTKVYDYLKNSDPCDVLLIFQHGLGDVIIFLSIFKRLKQDFPYHNIKIGAETGRNYHLLLPDIFIPVDDNNKIDLKFKYVFQISYPEPPHEFKVTNLNVNVKPYLCNTKEIGIPDFIWSPYLNNIYKPIEKTQTIGLNFNGNSCANLKNCNIIISRKIWNEVRQAGYRQFELYIDYKYLLPSSKNRFELADPKDTFRYKRSATLVDLAKKIMECKYVISIDSGTLYLAGFILGYDKVIALQSNKWYIPRYFPGALNIINISDYRNGIIYERIREYDARRK